MGNRQPDSNAGCSNQKGVKNKQTRQLMLWIGALIVGAVLGMFGISWLDGLMNFIATVYTRLFQLLAVPTIALAVDRKSTRLNSSHITRSRMPSSA